MIVHHSPVDAAPTTSSFSIQHMASMDRAKITVREDKKHLSFWDFGMLYTKGFTVFRYGWGNTHK